MIIIKTAVQAVLKRPTILLVPLLLMLVFSLINTYNPLLPVLMGLSAVTGSSVLEGIVSALQILMDKSIIFKAAGLLALVGLATALVLGVVVSGWLYIIKNTLEGKERIVGEFREGIRNYFLRIFFVTLKSVFIFILLAAFLTIASVPAIIISKAYATTRPELLYAAVFIDMLTVAAIYFCLLYSRIYIALWFPAVIHNEQRPFAHAKGLADNIFWKVAARIFVFDLFFIAFQYLFITIGGLELNLIAGWIFYSIYLALFTVFIFYAYRAYPLEVLNRVEPEE